MIRRTFLLAGAAMPFAATRAFASQNLLPEAPLGDDGLHKPDWYNQSFLDIGEDLAEAQDQGKGLAVFVEQAGCPYCKEMYSVNLRIPETVDLIRARFNVLQLDLRGSREATDTDGEVLQERDLVRKWGVVFTPTLILFAPDTDVQGKSGREAAAAIMPGYFKPFHFDTMFDYVASGEHKTKHFQDFLNERAARMRAEGKDVDIWQ